MSLLFWDACGLVKHYAPEVGSATSDALFAAVPATQMVITLLGYAETYSILLRRRNQGAISRSTFLSARSPLRSEVIENSDFTVLHLEEADILTGIDLMERHNINASGGGILAAYLTCANSPEWSGVPCVLVSSDQRLLRAAPLEGLNTLDPESVLATDVSAFLAGL